MLRSKPALITMDQWEQRVSILVLVDVALEVNIFAKSPQAYVRFNPCSRGCCARSSIFCYHGSIFSVSILVLVDVALEVGTRDFSPEAGGGFNPCSRGCCARSFHHLDLFLRVVKFQSLFSWMLRSKAGHRGWLPQRHQFQSLFSWMLRSKSICDLCSAAPYCSFNPCSRGCCARRTRDRIRGWKLYVSILVLVDVALEATVALWRANNTAMFQSLFSWMLRSKENTVYNPRAGKWFQSLFSWMLRSKLGGHDCCSCAVRVSILVLVDVALEVS